MSSFVFSGSALSGIGPVNYPLNTYVPLEELRSYFSLGSQNTTDDETLKDIIYRSSRSVDRYTRRHFYPKVETRRYDIPKDDTLRLDRDFLSVSGLSHMNGTQAIDPSVYWLSRGEDWNLRPYDRIVLNDTSGSRFNYTGTPRQAVHVQGVTGFHESGGWVYSGASLHGDLTCNNPLAFVGGSTGQDDEGFAPRFKAGQIIKLENEFAHIEYGSGLSYINIKRGINGTAMASHGSNTGIYVWKPESDIQFYTKRLASWAYMQSQSPYTERISVPGYGSIDVPGNWPKDIREGLTRFKRTVIKVVY
jgi:hypothetical protein